MNKNLLLSIISFSIFLQTGCTTNITPQEYNYYARPVEVSKVIPANCQKIGTFKANGQSLGFAYAVEMLRYKVGKKGGNLAVVEKTSSSIFGTATVTGSGYQCTAPETKTVTTHKKP